MIPNLYIATTFLVVGLTIVALGEKFTGPGIWSVVNVMKCEEDEDMPLRFDVNRRKLNRTHDGFNAKMKLEEDIDDTYGVRIDICKYVDGGCKPYHVLTDDSLAHLVLKYAQDNVEQALMLAGIDPPELPVTAGDYEVNNYVINYDELPDDCPYGEYGAKAFMTKDGQDKSCASAIVRCDEIDDEDGDEER